MLNTSGRRGRFLSSKYLDVRRYLWKRLRGEIAPHHQLRHTYSGCSDPQTCVNPAHVSSVSLQDHVRIVLSPAARRRHRFGSGALIQNEQWPGTRWERIGEDELGAGLCRHCHREFIHHGALEWVGRKLKVPVNQQAYLCRPLPSPPLARRRVK